MTKLKSILSFFLFILSLQCINAQGYLINTYNVDVLINQEGYITVQERIVVDFREERRGIFRDVPRKVNINGKDISIKLSDVNVKGHPYTVLNENGNYRIRIGDPDVYLTGKQSYDLSYKVENPFVFEKNHTEFIYNIVADWNTTIDKVKYSITTPTDLDMPFNDYKIYTGLDGQDERNASIKKQGMIFYGETFRPLQKEENVTVAIKLPVDYIKRPEPPVSIFKKDYGWFAPLGLIVLLFNFFFKSRQEFGHDITGRVMYPPEGLSPAEVGAYHDNRVNVEDIISLIPYWAEKGKIKVMSNEMHGNDKDLYFKRLEDLEPDAPEYQRRIFDALFEKDELILLSELKNNIYKIIYSASQDIKKSLLGKQMYDMDHYKRFHSGRMIAIGLVIILVGILIIIFTPYKLSGIALIPLGIVAFVIHFLRPKRSEKGLRYKAELDALKRTLETSSGEETARLIKENPNYFEKLYPYAIALGIDKTWLHKMQDHDVYAPYWYGYYGHPHQSQISMNDFSKSFSVPEIKSVFTSVPAGSSSGGGGGFSGGSAGGGFGGGGGSW